MFVYYMETESNINLDDQVRERIPHLDRVVIRECYGGPGGGRGVVVGQDDQVKYDPGTQTWKKFPDYWVGWESLPGPDDLKRENMLPGYLARLGDGKEWLIPIARLITGEPGMDRVYSLGEDGRVRWEIQEKYRELFDFASWWLGMISGTDTDKHGHEWTDEGIFRMISRIIGVNYRVGLYEVSVLGLVTDISIKEIMRVVCDIPGMTKILEAAKKKQDGIGE